VSSLHSYLFKSALSTAFSPGHVRRESASTTGGTSGTDAQTSDSTLVEAPVANTGGESAGDAWKAEYETNVQSWRAQSAEMREKAENERARWERIRAAEKEESTHRKTEGLPEPPSSWETKNKSSGQVSGATIAASPSPVDAKDDNGVSNSQKWETVHVSPTSSYPSMSFPGQSGPPSPEPRNRRLSNHAPPPSATLAILDNSLSTRMRLSALLSSLAINLLLPFVNGVMLGFGEIFAKNVVIGWFGWQIPGSVATNVGVGLSRTRPR
jgi:hypothetical protein